MLQLRHHQRLKALPLFGTTTKSDVQVVHMGTMTNSEMMDPSPFHIEHIKDNDEAMKFYTGFPTFYA